MIKVEVIEDFDYKDYDKIKDLKRKNFNLYGKLFVGDTFICNKEMVEYLTKKNDYKRAFVKIIEIKKEE